MYCQGPPHPEPPERLVYVRGSDYLSYVSFTCHKPASDPGQRHEQYLLFLNVNNRIYVR